MPRVETAVLETGPRDLEPVLGHRSLPEHVAALLHRRMVEGVYPPGSQLPHQRDLARDLGVSVGVVRESLALLASGGLVWSRAGKGTFVTDAPGPSIRFPAWTSEVGAPDELAEVAIAREVLEEALARLAAEHRTEEDLASLERYLAEMDRCRAEPEAFAAADLAFHETLATAARNRPLASALLGLRRLVARSLARRARDALAEDGAQRALGDHRMVLDAVRRRDPEGAAAALRPILARARLAATDDPGAPT